MTGAGGTDDVIPDGDDRSADHDGLDPDGSARDVLPDPGIDVDAITSEELAARRRVSAIDAGRRKGGTVGAAMAGAMIALSEIYEGPKRDEIVAVSESPDEPTDIDTDGIRVDIGDVSIESKLPSASDDDA